MRITYDEDKPLPEVGDRIHEKYGGLNDWSGIVVCVVDDETTTSLGPMIGYRVWSRRKQRWRYRWMSAYAWRIGPTGIGPLPRGEEEE